MQAEHMPENELNDAAEQTEETAAAQEAEESPVQKAEKELAEMKDKYLRLYSEFENFRRRTSKEKIEMVKTAAEDTITSLLPVLDDFERAMKAIGTDELAKPLREGVELVYNKTLKTLQAKGLVRMESIGHAFDSDLHEAITQIPATEAAQKGKVVDEVEPGYLLGEKVIRFAKVVIGA